MNTSSLAKKKFPISLEGLFSQFLPKRVIDQALLWALLPLFFSLANLEITFLYSPIFAPYFPLLALITVAACLFFRTSGLVGSYLILTCFVLFFIPQTPFQERLCSMGIIFSHALTLFLFLLALEESAECFKEIELEAEEAKQASKQLNLTWMQAVKTFEEKEREFNDEIQRLKEEAEQRKIERRGEIKRFELIQSEIEAINSQKESFIAEARSARGQVAEYLEKIDSLNQQALDHVQEIQDLKIHNSLLNENVAMRESLTQAAQVESEMLKRELAQTTNLMRQYLEEIGHLKTYSEILSEDLKISKNDLNHITHELEIKEVELQKLNEDYQNYCATSQETITQLQEFQNQLQTNSSSTSQLKQAVASAEGLYHQLRLQFNEKTEILGETRKALFQLEGELALREKEFEDRLLEEQQENGCLGSRQSEDLLQEISSLQDEIKALEELISRILIP